MNGLASLSPMPSSLLRFLPFVLAGMLAGGTACAQLYKWVDERGVTNYSNQPPADPAAMNKLRPIDNRVSVYSPDPALTSAIEAFQRSGEQGIATGTSRAAASYGQRQPAPVVMQDPCLNGNTMSCTGDYSGYVPYDPGYGYVRPPIRRPRHIAQPHFRPGAIAGAVVGMDGYIPGYSAYAPPARALPAPRTLYEAPVPAPRGPARR